MARKQEAFRPLFAVKQGAGWLMIDR